MKDDDKDTGGSGDIFSHRPLPYIVRLRAIDDADRPPQALVSRQVAYSVSEAVIQAFYEAGGTPLGRGRAKIEIDGVEPDVAAYCAQLASLAGKAVAGASR